MQITQFKKTDLKEAAELYCNAFNGAPWHEHWIIKIAYKRLLDILNTPGFVGFTHRNKNKLNGFTIGNIEHWYDCDTFLVREMCTDPFMQRQGIGSSLFKKLISKLQSRNITSIYLLTLKNSSAANFYKKNGFKEDTAMNIQRLKIKTP